MSISVLISDLHLEAARPDLTAFFEAFLQTVEGRIQDLYILGDFFETWIGDDAAGEFENSIAQKLNHLHLSGTHIHLMHGNRDFLIGQAWLDQFGGQLLEDPTTLELEGLPCTLMHGDTLCTDDFQYMKFRETARSEAWQAQILAMPVAQRRQLADALRGASQSSQQMKSMEIMDANADAIEAAFRASGTPWLIHGHTHRPDIHTHTVDGRQVKRMVLGDWGDVAHIGIVQNGEAPRLVRIEKDQVGKQLKPYL
ncbi:MAG: UDP-2,3-diacylglucosamine diphosphatase [Gammaproteobacteria bacterium]|nr:MAG: UDP-2,3-diacylglucosamine diphosphatase [Gammaproteobacteria bacterium]